MSRYVEHAPAERWQHGGQDREVNAAGREAVARPVTALLRAKRIGDAEVVAAERFYRGYFFGIEGAMEEREGPSGAPSPDGVMVARMDAAYDYSTAMQALDPATFRLIRALVLEERSFASLVGSTSRRPAIRLAEQAAVALKALADHYATQDCFCGGYGVA